MALPKENTTRHRWDSTFDYPCKPPMQIRRKLSGLNRLPIRQERVCIEQVLVFAERDRDAKLFACPGGMPELARYSYFDNLGGSPRNGH